MAALVEVTKDQLQELVSKHFDKISCVESRQAFNAVTGAKISSHAVVALDGSPLPIDRNQEETRYFVSAKLKKYMTT